MENELYKTIEDLKKTLEDVSSARHQVDETVAAYAQTRKEIKAYVGGLEGVEAGLRKVLGLLQANEATLGTLTGRAAGDLKSVCDGVADNARLAIGDSVDSAVKALDGVATRFEGRVDAISLSIKRREDSLCGSIGSSTKELGQIIVRFNALTEELGKLLGQVLPVAETVSDNSRKLSDLIAAVRALRAELADGRREQNEALARMRDGIRINRVLSVVSLAVLVLTAVSFAVYLSL